MEILKLYRSIPVLKRRVRRYSSPSFVTSTSPNVRFHVVDGTFAAVQPRCPPPLFAVETERWSRLHEKDSTVSEIRNRHRATGLSRGTRRCGNSAASSRVKWLTSAIRLRSSTVVFTMPPPIEILRPHARQLWYFTGDLRRHKLAALITRCERPAGSVSESVWPWIPAKSSPRGAQRPFSRRFRALFPSARN